MSPIRMPDPAEICLTVVITTFAIQPFGVTPATASSLDVSEKAVICRSDNSESTLFVDSKAEKSVKFHRLTEQWRAERGATASITKMSMTPAYQKIIGMGQDAVPFILAQLKEEEQSPDQWFWALKMITDADPVKSEDQGNFRAMAKAWLAWGENSEYAG